MNSREREHRAWLATIVEEIAGPLREMPYNEVAAKYLDSVDTFDFTRDGVWVQAEIEAWLEKRMAGPGSPMIVIVGVSGEGRTDVSPVSTMFYVEPPGTAAADA